METNNSQEFADYFNEYLIIEQISDEYYEDDSLKNSPDESSIFEAEWLRNIGFQSLVAKVEAGKDVDDDQFSPLFMCLTNRQANTVKKRITTFKTTVRKSRLHRSKIRDVRDVFPPNSESSSGGTRSRSATPDSLDSISPSNSPPTPNDDWFRGEQTGSPTPSQGYFSNTRSSPDVIDSPNISRFTVKNAIIVDESLRCPGDGCNSPEIVEREPDFVQIFKAPADRFSRKNEFSEGKQRRESFLKNKSHTSYEVPILRQHRQIYDLSSTGTFVSDSGIEILDYQPKGSISIHSGRQVVPQMRNGICESDISIEIQDDVEPSGQLDSDWGFERISGMDSDDDPDFIQVGGKIGVTRIDDLGEDDLKKIKKLALIELTALFDTYNIQFCRRKAMKRKKKDRDNLVFGVPLTTLIEHDRKIQPDCKVPLVIKQILGHLEKYGLQEEGILRISGVVGKIQLLKQEIEKNFYSSPGLVDDVLKNCSINDVAGLIKQFLRELPVPLLTNEYMDAFFQVEYIPEKVDQIKALKLLVFHLPEVHRNTLKRLFDFLCKVVAHESVNRMSLQNVAVLIAPNLFLPKKVKKYAERDIGIEINTAAITCKITKMMIKYKEILWTVPNFLIQQIRRMNEEMVNRKENGRHVKKLLTKTKVDRPLIYRKINNEVDYQDGVIRVDAKQFGKENTRVSLGDSTTARDVLEEIFHNSANKTKNQKAMGKESTKQCPVCFSSNLVDSHCLYEVGGNIAERCLDWNANMIAVYQQNPNAKWEIRCKHKSNQSFVEELLLM